MARLLLLGISLIISAYAVAGAPRGADCMATAAIVEGAVAMRAGGSAQTVTAGTLQTGGVEAKYIDAVAHLVDWVYTLPEDQLTEEAIRAYNDACLAQLG